MSTTTSLAVVGSGLVAWQTFNLVANLKKEKAEHAAHCAVEELRQRWAQATQKDPEYISLPTNYINNVSNAGNDVQQELKSMMKFQRHWKLLRHANAGDQGKVKELSLISKDLGDGEMRQLAQAISRETVIWLASRIEHPDPRFFLPPPLLPSMVETLNIPNLFRVVLSSLPTDNVNECINYFTTTALKNYVATADEDTVQTVDLEQEFLRDTHHVYSIPRKQYYTGCRSGESVFLEYCLQALLSHSTIESHCEEMIKTPMLPLFVRILTEHKDNARIKSLVGKILANMAVFKSTHRAIHEAGFVGILANWKNDPNLLVTLPASKALKNLDQPDDKVYEPGVYVILDKMLDSKSKGVDVVFIHGLLGGVFHSWRQSDPKNARGWGETELISNQEYSYCWPKDWMKEDALNGKGVRVIGVDFDTCLSQWGNSCPRESFKTSLHDRSLDIYSKLRKCGVGDRPTVFVGHSMGGLIIKKILTEVSVSQDEQFVSNTKGIVFYSTPHNGSEMAKLTKATKLLFFPSMEVKELEANSPALAHLHQRFLDLASDVKMKVVSFGETKATPYMGLDMTFVSPESSDPGCGEHVEVQQNHMEICKPSSKSSILYRKLVNLIWDSLEEDF